MTRKKENASPPTELSLSSNVTTAPASCLETSSNSDVGNAWDNSNSNIMNKIKAAVTNEDGDTFGNLEFETTSASKAVKSSMMGVWCCNVSTGVLRWNSHMFTLFDFDPQPSCIVRYEDFIEKLHPDDRDGVHNKIMSAKLGTRYEAVYRVVWRNGSIKTYSACSDHYEGEDGSDLMVGTVFDITEITLKKQIETENQVLSAALAEQKRHNDETTMVLRTMSHELRNPLQGILGSWSTFESVLEEASKQDSSKAMKSMVSQLRLCMQDQQECVTHQLSTINDLLCFSTVEGRPLRVKTVRLDHTVSSVVKMFLKPAESKGLKITQTLSPGLCCRTDEQYVKRILVNLLSNSLKFTSTGSISVDGSRAGNCVTVNVTDTGLGMPEEFRDKLFATIGLTETNDEYAGAGLGLNICHKLAKKLGGNIAHTPNVPQGTIMTFTFCDIVLDDGDRSESDASETREDLSLDSIDFQLSLEEQLSILKNKRILVAEDNSINARVLKRMLEPLVQTLTICSNGLEATVKFEEQHGTATQFDLCTLDIHMPKMNGIEAAKLILAMEPDVPVVFLTGETGETAKDLCRHYSSYDLLIKPCSKAELTRALAQAFYSRGHVR